MDNSVWRSRARIVAYVDLVLASLGLVGLIFGVVAGVALTAAVNEKGSHLKISEDARGQAYVLMIIYWIALAVSAIFIFIQVWLSLTLIKATEIGIGITKSLELSRTWRTVNVILMVISFILSIFVYGITVSVISLAIRSGFIYIVHSYIKELEGQAGRVDGDNHVNAACPPYSMA